MVGRYTVGRCPWGLAVLGVLALGCRGSEVSAETELGPGPAAETTTPAARTTGAPPDASEGSSGGAPDFPPAGPPGGDACPGLSCLPCGQGIDCAPAPPYLEGTCCAEGDALRVRGEGEAYEAVDVEVAGDLVFVCGGFGVSISDVSNPDDPAEAGRVPGRCQNIAVGPTDARGRTIFWLAHHGDTWVESPFLASYRLDPAGAEGSPAELHRIEDSDILFEGIEFRDGFLYVAVHGGGLRTYAVDETTFELTLTSVLGGFSNATEIAGRDDVLFVADQIGGVKVVGLEDPASPTLEATLETTGMARDVAVHGEGVAVALGGGGVDILDVPSPFERSSRTSRRHVQTDGSAQAVVLRDDILAVAAWTHVAVYDRDSLQLLATERVRRTPEFEQDLGIAASGDLLHVAEWEGLHVLEYRPGLVAADLWLDEEIIEFDGDVAGARVVRVRNRGMLDLDIDEIGLGVDGPFTPDTRWVRVPPLRSAAFEVSYEPSGFNAFATLALHSNDPDPQQSPHQVPLSAIDTDQIDVGDPLTEDFGFLDPRGTGSVEGLRGKVVVLAYFALF